MLIKSSIAAGCGASSRFGGCSPSSSPSSQLRRLPLHLQGRRRFTRPRAAPRSRASTISGLIRGDQDRVEALAALSKASNARAVIIHVDSPGGTTAGSEQLHNAHQA